MKTNLVKTLLALSLLVPASVTSSGVEFDMVQYEIEYHKRKQDQYIMQIEIIEKEIELNKVTYEDSPEI